MTLALNDREQDALNSIHVAALRQERKNAREEKLRYAQVVIEHALYQASMALDPDEPRDRRMHRKPRFAQIAQMAIALIDESTEREALRQAEVTFDDSLNQLEANALVLDADHSRRDLVEAALLRFRLFMQREKPMSGALSVFKQALTKGRGL